MERLLGAMSTSWCCPVRKWLQGNLLAPVSLSDSKLVDSGTMQTSGWLGCWSTNRITGPGPSQCWTVAPRASTSQYAAAGQCLVGDESG